MSLRIVFFGTPDFAVPSLDAILNHGFDVAAVVTMPDKPAGRGQQVKSSPIKQYALSHGIPILQPERLKDPDFLGILQSLQADIHVVIAFRMLPEQVWNMPPLGTLNLHGSLLPNYRGAAPIQRAIMDGCTTTGLTTFFLVHEIDCGRMVLQEETPINPSDHAGSLHERMALQGAELMVRTLRLVETGNYTLTEQQWQEGMPLAPKITKADQEINWQNSAVKIHNQIRGLSPFPGSFFVWNRQQVKVYYSLVLPESLNGLHKAGDWLISDGRFMVQTGQGSIELLEIQLEGKKKMDVKSFLLGYRGPQAGQAGA